MARLLLPVAALALSGPAFGLEPLPPHSGPYAGYLPDTSLFTATEEPPPTQLVERLFALAHTEHCGAALDGGYGGSEPQVFDLTYSDSFGEPPGEKPFRLYQFNCTGGAYNLSSAFYGWDSVSGLRPLSFAEPDFAVSYAEAQAGEEEDRVVTGIAVTGMGASLLLTNAEVAPAEGTIVATGYWRGIGDAFSRGVWVLRNGEFSLTSYEVDASYDGEAEPMTVLDYSGTD